MNSDKIIILLLLPTYECTQAYTEPKLAQFC